MQNLYNTRILMNNLAFADIRGSNKYPYLNGKVIFKQLNIGVLVTVEVNGLPYEDKACSNNIYGFHIHQGMSCTGTVEDPFLDAKSHFSKTNCVHPYHSGDMPPLFGNKGYAYMSFLTDRFFVDDIIGKVVIIHSKPDDFKTNPSGDSGDKIACGKIVAI